MKIKTTQRYLRYSKKSLSRKTHAQLHSKLDFSFPSVRPTPSWELHAGGRSITHYPLFNMYAHIPESHFRHVFPIRKIYLFIQSSLCLLHWFKNYIWSLFDFLITFTNIIQSFATICNILSLPARNSKGIVNSVCSYKS